MQLQAVCDVQQEALFVHRLERFYRLDRESMMNNYTSALQLSTLDKA
jgi:hypothetical protein